MKKRSKAALLLVSALLLVTATVFATVAYLTSKDEVNNTFTVGKVAITLDEYKTDEYGTADTEVARVKANTYKLIPGHTYTKDPTVHFLADSEESYLFVKVENGIAAIESTETSYNSIADQVLANGWMELGTGYPGVYYRVAPATTGTGATDTDYPVFGNFTIDETVKNKPATPVTGELYVEDYETAVVKVSAYAIQKDGFTDAATAWGKF